jgi:hypothetical protein
MVDQPNGEAPRPLERAKSSIDFLVSSATVVYALGYLSWAVYSWDRGLDLPPALEGQYFIAGIVPALLLVLLLLIVAGLAKLRARLSAPAKKSDRGWHKILDSVGLALIFGGALSSYLTKHEWIYATMLPLGGAALGISWFFSPEKIDRAFARGFSWYGLFAAAVLSFALMLAYATKVFPYLPSEFGGPEVGCASLDLKRSDFSDATLELLTLQNVAGSQAEVVRSRPVNMLSAPGRYYLIAVSNSPSAKYMKVKTELVHAIVPSDNCGAGA